MTQAAINQRACSGVKIGPAGPVVCFIVFSPVLLLLAYARSGAGGTAYVCS